MPGERDYPQHGLTLWFALPLPPLALATLIVGCLGGKALAAATTIPLNEGELPMAIPAGPPPTTNRCPTSPEPLMAGLLADLPRYANLVASRSLGLPPVEGYPSSTVLIASTADFEPIDLSERTNAARLDPSSEIQQVFFTTLERQFLGDQIIALQNHHWLFLVQGEDGWRLGLMYSSLANYPEEVRPPTPPQESSEGIIGQAVRLWLRDCRAGAIEFPEVTPGTTGR